MNLFKGPLKPQYLFSPRQAIRRVVRELDHAHYESTEILLPWKLKIKINPNEAIGTAIWHQGLYDLVVSETLWRLLDAGDAAIDVGANIGHMTSIMALRVGPGGKVLSFEPHPATFEELQHNISLFKQSPNTGEIFAYRVALSDSEGEAHLVCDNLSNPSSAYLANSARRLDASSIPIHKVRVEDLIGQNDIAVMKLDVEGHELTVLRGAEGPIKRSQIRNIVYEDLDVGRSPVHDFLSRNNYSLFGLGWRMWKPILCPIDRLPKIESAYEPPSYLATLEPGKTLKRFRRWGWSILET